jgi:hypothetical protein
VDDFIPPEIRYACQYWVDHLDLLDPTTRLSTDLSDNGEVHKFLQQHFLHWLEVLSLTESLPKSLAMLRNLEAHINVSFSHQPTRQRVATHLFMTVGGSSRGGK